jgi:hypothetical protein
MCVVTHRDDLVVAFPRRPVKRGVAHIVPGIHISPGLEQKLNCVELALYERERVCVIVMYR